MKYGPLTKKLLLPLMTLMALGGFFQMEEIPVKAISTTLIISEVYGGGGSDNNGLKYDFVEICSLSDIAINLSGWSLQYAAATSNNWTVCPLSGSVIPHTHYLIQLTGGSKGAALPLPDLVASLTLGATNGKIASKCTPFSGQKWFKERGFFMPKYDVEFKKKCIKAYEEGKALPTVPGVLPISMIKFVTQWRLLLKEQGERGLTNEIIYRTYSLKDKIKAVKRVNESESYSAVARSLGMRTHSTVRRWHMDYMEHGVAGLQYRKGIKPSTSVVISNPMKKRLTKAEKEELIALRKRNEILEIENEYLKKLDALVSKRERAEAKAKKRK